MPNRIIKESIWTSPNLNSLSPEAERHFFRLLPAADDWGCTDITPVVVKGKCYPLQQSISTKDIEQWNAELETCKLIKVWVDNSRIYGQFLTFILHNELKEHHNPKTPCPPWDLNKGFDPRLPDKTLQAYNKISDAFDQLSNNGHKPTLREIAKLAGSSLTTVQKFLNITQKNIDTRDTDVTGKPKNR